MNFTVECLSDLPSEFASQAIERALEIFYETSARSEFKTQQDRIDFEHKYFRSYLDHPDLVFFARRQNQIAGYLLGAIRTTEAHYQLNPYLLEFRSEIDRHFPSHLHINLTQSARGSGTGSLLMSAFEDRIRQEGSVGVHIVTSASARNVDFYAKNGFDSIQTAENGDSKILLMGKRLSK